MATTLALRLRRGGSAPASLAGDDTVRTILALADRTACWRGADMVLCKVPLLGGGPPVGPVSARERPLRPDPGPHGGCSGPNAVDRRELLRSTLLRAAF